MKTALLSSRLEALLARTRALRCSDLHLQPGLRPHVRLQGELIALEEEPALEGGLLEGLLLDLLSDLQRARLAEQGYLDLSYRDASGTTWRCHYFHQRTGLSAALRPLAARIPTLDELRLPPELERLAHLQRGLVLITGATGSGKSTTLAALVGIIDRTYRRTVLTLEDPIEYLFDDPRGVIEQREVGTHVESFARGVQDALLARPDVLVVGELRDPDSVQGALAAAETGALVLATLHSNDAVQTLDRLIDMFPLEDQPQTRAVLSQSLQAVVSQVLVHEREGKGRRPACEVMFRTPAVASLIRDDRTHELRSVIETGRALGMRLLDDALADLVAGGLVAREEARRFARDPRRFGEPLPAEPVGPLAALLGRAPGSIHERRQEPRVRALELVNVGELNEVGLQTALTVGRTLDLSHEGVRVELEHPLLLRSRALLDLALEDRVVQVEGLVVSVAEAGPRSFAHGLRFVDPSDAARQAIDDYLALRR